MKLYVFISLLAASVSSFPAEQLGQRAIAACSALGSDETFQPNTATYTAESQHYWSATDFLTPGCVYDPTSAADVASAVKTLANLNATFAVRGGGHMPLVGYSNTDGGVLVAMTKLNKLKLSKDKSRVSIGPGNRWIDVYRFLEPHGLVVAGGRDGSVGTGLLLGGGISFFGGQYGFSSDGVVGYQVVVADGSIVHASKSNKYSDLFWALKAGGNSFGIITAYHLETHSAPKIYAGVLAYEPTALSGFLDALYSFAITGDNKAALIPNILYTPALNLTAPGVTLFYDGADGANKLQDFRKLPQIPSNMSTEYGPTTLAKFSNTTLDPPIPMRYYFGAVAAKASRETLDIYVNTMIEMSAASMSKVKGFQFGVSMQPISKNFIQQGYLKGGNPQGVSIADAPYIWFADNFIWMDPADDETVYAFEQSVNAAISQKLKAAGLLTPYLYQGDCAKGQPSFQNYGEGNLAKLKSIRAKYDPLKVFTDLMPGGWKVDAA